MYTTSCPFPAGRFSRQKSRHQAGSQCGRRILYYDKGYDPRQSAQADPCVCGAADAGQPVPAVLQSGRYHHRGPLCGRGSAGRCGQRGRFELSGAGFCERHRLRFFHPHLVDFRRKGLQGDAPLHCQHRVAFHLLCGGADHCHCGADPLGAGVDEHPGKHHRPCGYLYPHHFCRHPLHSAL